MRWPMRRHHWLQRCKTVRVCSRKRPLTTSVPLQTVQPYDLNAPGAASPATCPAGSTTPAAGSVCAFAANATFEASVMICNPNSPPFNIRLLWPGVSNSFLNSGCVAIYAYGNGQDTLGV